MTQKYVLTGGPCTGKTTLLEHLCDRYTIVAESAREIIAEQSISPQPILPWTDIYNFQLLVLYRQQQKEISLNGNDAFLDRSIIDGLAYCLEAQIRVPKLEAAIKNTHYDLVFLLDPLPYNQDNARREDAMKARHLHNLIAQVYEQCGYHPITVPVLPPHERVHFVDQKIREQQKENKTNQTEVHHGRML